MKIMLFATAYNGLCQRVHRELILSGHQLSVELSNNADVMQQAFSNFSPDLVICPFLKHRIPDSIWQYVPCLVLHPGVAGDRGPSSLDWTIVDPVERWGATLLQANHDFDAGAIWATCEFKMRQTSKASLYRNEITQRAAKMIGEAVNKFALNNKNLSAMKLKQLTANDYQWRRLMKQFDRQIDWLRDSSASIVNKINAADSFPGVLDEINGRSVYLFGARYEAIEHADAKPGTLLGQRDEAVCRATKDGAVWIRQMKLAKSPSQSFFKLPAMRVLTTQIKLDQTLPALSSPIQNDIRVEINEQVAYLYFDFYNGAFNSEQCVQLLTQFKIISSQPEINIVVLMGGEDFWSNGIHLHCIEHAKDSAKESWRNINAINDLVESLINCDSVLTIAALRRNAGAGGAIVPLACDYVVARKGVILNPHYQLMGLTGSEYWSYLLPKRVGEKKALKLMRDCLPLLAQEALEINMVDSVFDEDPEVYHQLLVDYCQKLSKSDDYEMLLKSKNALRKKEQRYKKLSTYRSQELKLMRDIFKEPSSHYHLLRHLFVHKIDCGKTPKRLRSHTYSDEETRVEVG